MGTFKDITGKQYGRLIAIKATNKRKFGYVVWECKCECGNLIDVPLIQLEQGNTLSCGCLQSENVAKRNKQRLTKDLANKRFGRLIALKPTDKREGSFVIWECICDCNKKAFVSSGNLLSGNTSSCGCFNSELAKKHAKVEFTEYRDTNIVSGTRMDYINREKINKNNKSGVTGVSKRKKDGKFVAQIVFQGKKYWLGSYYTVEEASEARKIAEERLHGEFLEWHNQYIKE